jgi:hypothetical protein
MMIHVVDVDRFQQLNINLNSYRLINKRKWELLICCRSCNVKSHLPNSLTHQIAPWHAHQTREKDMALGWRLVPCVNLYPGKAGVWIWTRRSFHLFSVRKKRKEGFDTLWLELFSSRFSRGARVCTQQTNEYDSMPDLEQGCSSICHSQLMSTGIRQRFAMMTYRRSLWKIQIIQPLIDADSRKTASALLKSR